MAPSGASAAFPQCPPVGIDTSCQYLITITNSGASVQNDPTQLAYERDEDSLIGVQNNSSGSVSSLPMSVPAGTIPPLFGFDGDGLCNPGSGAVPPGCPFPRPPGAPPTYIMNGYEGPDTWFSDISTDKNSGTVNFSPALARNSSTYFSLEAPPSASSLQVGTPTTTAPTKGVIGLPPSKKCVSRRNFRIRVRQRNGILIASAVIKLNGKAVKVLKQKVFGQKRHTATVNLRGLPKGTFVVQITVLTTEGNIIKGKRKYHTCTKKRKNNRPPKL